MNVRILLVVVVGLLAGLAPVTAQDAATCAPGLRLFDHPRLATAPICVPEDPQRVVALESASYDILVAVGEPPIGAVGYLEAVTAGNMPYMTERIAGIANVGSPPDLESILALAPDLIVVSTFNEDIYNALSAIAPTAMYTSAASGEWKDWLDFAGALLGREDDVARLFAEYEARVATLQELIDDPAALDVSVVRITPDRVMLNMANSFPSVVLADVGLARPGMQALSADEAQAQYGNQVGVFVSLEELALADGDVIFVWGQRGDQLRGYEADATWQTLEANPIWQTLGAVQNGRVVRTGGYWVGWGFAAAHAVLDDLFVALADVDPADVAPNPFRVAQVTPTTPDTTESTCADGFRLVTHVAGETCAPTDSQRVVVLHPVTSAWFAPGMIGVHLLLDDVVRYVAEQNPADIAPNPFVMANMD